MIVPDYALWIVLFVFFAAEHVKWLDERAAILELRDGAKARVHISRFPIRIGRRYLYILPVTGVMRTYYTGNFFCSRKFKASGGSWEMRRICLINQAVSPFLILEPALFLFYFVLCPVLTFRVGLGIALRLILPVHIGLLLICAAMIFWLPGLPLRGTMKRLGLVAEIFICPGLMPALSKRLSSKVVVVADVPLSAATSLILRRREQMCRVVTDRLQELIEFGEATPEAVGNYLAELGVPE